MLNENVTPFLTRWLRNMTCSQQKNGAIPNVIPLTGIYELLEKLNRIVYRNFEPVGEAGWGRCRLYRTVEHVSAYRKYQDTERTV